MADVTAEESPAAIASRATTVSAVESNVNNSAKTTHEDEGILLPWMNIFLGTKFASFITNPVVKANIAVVYLAILVGAIIGIIDLEQGLQTRNLTPDGSYFHAYSDRFNADFYQEYGVWVNVGIDETLDYTDADDREQIQELKSNFRNSNYFLSDESAIVCWLDFYLTFLQGIPQDIDSMDMPTFISILENNFFTQDAFQHFQADVVINGDSTQITQSRFFVQSTNLGDSNDERSMMLEARDIADDSSLEVVVFGAPFPFFDQFVVILFNTLQTLGVAVASMMVVSLFFIPSLSTAVWVTLTTVSICACVIGYMAHWDVSLDSISMINLVMCVGFSVDFAAHFSYHYVVSSDPDPRERVRDAMGCLGTPVVQAALSTILGVSILSTSDSYIFRTFFKLVLLVMTFGFFHAMFLLPVLLSTLNTRLCKGSAAADENPELASAPSAKDTTATVASSLGQSKQSVARASLGQSKQSVAKASLGQSKQSVANAAVS